MKRLLVPVLLSLSLVACGGGGGGGGSLPGTGGGGQTQAAVETVPVQRALANQTLSSTNASEQLFGFMGGSAGAPLSVRRRLIGAASANVMRNFSAAAVTRARLRPMTAPVYSACSNGIETASVVVSPTEQQVYVRSFYDAACTELYQDLYLDIVAASASTATGTGTIATYSLHGTETNYETLVISVTGTSVTNQSMSVELTEALNSTSPAFASVGVACVVANSSLSCGFGGVDHDQTAGNDLGVTMTVSAATTASSTAGFTNVSVSGSVTGYTGAYNALSLAAGTMPSWTVSGGSATDTASVTGSLAFSSAGAASSGSMTVTDSADQGSATLSASPSGAAGVITDTASGKTIATFNVDAAGDGTITFNNGSTATIRNWTILG